MRALLPPSRGAGSTPQLGACAEPVAGAGEVLLEVHATALNHADLLQLRGLYPPPPGESEMTGLEGGRPLGKVVVRRDPGGD